MSSWLPLNIVKTAYSGSKPPLFGSCMNDTQQAQILDWFGSNTQGGKIFYYPTIYFIWAFLGIAGVPTVNSSR